MKALACGILALCVLTPFTVANAADLIGRASVIDGDPRRGTFQDRRRVAGLVDSSACKGGYLRYGSPAAFRRAISRHICSIARWTSGASLPGPAWRLSRCFCQVSMVAKTGRQIRCMTRI